MAHDDIRVPTVPVTVELLLSEGARLAATIPLSSTSPFHEGAEILDEFLNAPRLAVRRGKARAGVPLGGERLGVEGTR